MIADFEEERMRTEESEEAQAPKGIRVDERPSDEEVAEHNLTHIPFRSWCPHCVRGKCGSTPRSTAGKDESTIPVIPVGYACMKERDA